MSYRRSYFLEILGYLLVNIVDLFAIYFLFLNFPSLKGWNMWQVVYLYGLASVSLAIAQLLGEGLEHMPETIRTGEFDRVMIRPLPPIIQLMPYSFRIDRLGRLLQGVLAIGLAFYYGNFSLGLFEIVMIFIGIISAVIIYFGLFLANAALCFWTVQSTEVFNAFTYGGVEMTKYPITIYRWWMQKVFLFIVPLGFVTYFPTIAMLGRPDEFGFGPWAPYLAIPISIVFLLATLRLWRIGLNHYQSTGS
jgi:ABC-2 type transport system permease protein